MKSLVEEGNIDKYLVDKPEEVDEQEQNIIPIVVDEKELKEKEKQEDIQVITYLILVIDKILHCLFSYSKNLQWIRNFSKI